MATMRIPYGNHPEQIADLRVPAGPGPHPVLVVFHGGGFRADSRLDRIGPVCESLTEAGIATWNVEYRRLGEAGGGWPRTWEDAAAATDLLRSLAREHRLDMDRVATLGHSAGAPLALWTAARHRVPTMNQLYTARALPIRACVAMAGVYDLAGRAAAGGAGSMIDELIGGMPDSCPDRYAACSPVQLLPYGLPLLVVHGTADETVPLADSESFVARGQAAGDRVTLTTVPGADHFAIRDVSTPHWAPVREAIVAFLGPVLNI